MFLCEPCHMASGCPLVINSDLAAFLENKSRSHDRCECCEEVAICWDCHRYDFRKNPDHKHLALGQP